ncbi:MAG TPA: hypothetical protein PK530_06060 [Anaerolineales bacterium]|nr:hypothetical protein [Anaerolineales bacterium]
MNPEQAWQASIGQLQMEMPKATFEKWVRRARFTHYEHGKFIIGVEDELSRSWLVERLTSTLNRILMGVLNEPVEVYFEVTRPQQDKLTPEAAWQIVLEDLKTQLSTSQGESHLNNAQFLAFYSQRFIVGFSSTEGQAWATSKVNGPTTHRLAELMGQPIELQFVVTPNAESFTPTQPTKQTNEASKTLPRPSGLTRTESEVLIAPLRTSLYEIFTRPKSVVIVPAYFLRWLPYLGPDKGWFLIAMRQRYYQVFGKKVSRQPYGQVFTASREQIARWSGLGKNLAFQFLQELDQTSQPGNYLAWFMQSYEQGRGKAKTYSFRTDMPLTPLDATALQNWLLTHGIRETPLETLQLALEHQPRELLPFPPPERSSQPSEHVVHPLTIQEVVFNAAELQPTNPAYLPVKRLADALQHHLQSPADNLLLSHYFLLEWLPKLGRTPAWVIAILRDRGFIDHHTGIRRDRIKVEGGYGELARLLNVSERQIRDWLPAWEHMIRRGGEDTGEQAPLEQEEKGASAWAKHQEKRKLVGAFLEKTAEVDWSGTKETTYEFKVKLEEPLTPEHQEIHDLLETIIFESLSAGHYSALEAVIADLTDLLRESDNRFRTCSANQTTDLELAPRIGQVDETLFRESNNTCSANRTTEGESDPRFARLKALFLKYLYPKALLEIKQLLQQHLKELQHQETEHSQNQQGGGEEALIWNWDKLFGYGGLQRESQSEILADPEIQTQFLAQALYGFENKAMEDGKGIKTPFKFAERHRYERPLPEYMELAELPPEELKAVLEDWARQGPAFNLSDSAYRLAKTLREKEFLRVLMEATTKSRPRKEP